MGFNSGAEAEREASQEARFSTIPQVPMYLDIKRSQLATFPGRNFTFFCMGIRISM